MRTENNTTLCLYLSQRSILAVQAQMTLGRVAVVAQDSAEMPPRAMEGTLIANAPMIGEAIRSLLQRMNVRARSAVVALPSPGYALRSLRLPDVPMNEQRTLIRGELEVGAALPEGGGAYGYLWIPVPSQDGKHLVDAYAYYTTDAQVDGVREALKQAKLELEALEPASLATMRAYLLAMPQPDPIALLCMFEKHSDLCIHDGSRLRQIRRIPSGWAEMMQNVKASQRPSPLPARQNPLQQEQDVRGPLGEWIPDDADPAELPEGATLPMIAHEMLQQTSSFDFLSSEIARTLAFYNREFEETAQPQSLALLGPAEVVVALRSYLASRLAIPLADAPPTVFSNGNKDSSANVPPSGEGYLAAVGAAVGGQDTLLPRVDIARQEAAATNRRKTPSVLLAGMTGSTLWMLGAAAAAIFFSVRESNLRSESARLTQEITTIREQRAPLLRYQEILNAATAAQNKDRVPASSVLGRIAASSIPGVGLTSVHVANDGKVSIDGKAQDTGSMQRFATALGTGKTIHSPTFEMIRQDPKEGLTFRIVGSFRAPAGAEPQ